MNNSASDTYNSNLTDTLFVLFITLCSIKFYTFLIPFNVGKALALVGFCLTLGLYGIHLVYGNDSNIKKRFHLEVVMIFFALIISAFAAEFFHNQSTISTLLYQYEMYLFLFYFLLHRLRPDPDRLLNMFVLLAYIYTAIYILQYLAYPAELVSSRFSEDRGSIRIGIPGSDYMFMSWFILLSRYYSTKKIKYILGILPFVIVTILMATRQVLATITLLTLVSILFSNTLKSKAMVVLLIALAITPFYFIFQDIFNEIFEITQKQSDVQENIRYIAAQYFLFDLNHNPLWLITGNGMPAPHSEYGRFLFRIADELGYFQSDVGLIGDLSKFGILVLIAEVSFLIKLMVYKTNEKYSFIRYFAIATFLTMLTGPGLKAASIVSFCFMFYILDADMQIGKNSNVDKIKADSD